MMSTAQMLRACNVIIASVLLKYKKPELYDKKHCQ